MIELLLLVAVAYAGARGVEAVTGTADRRLDTKAAEKTVAKVAAGPGDGAAAKKPPGPAEPGGTFSAAAPRSARIGGKAAVPLAVVTETGATMWRAIGEGYRERWPEIRAERRQKMAERAGRRKTGKEAAEANAKAAEAVAKAGPPPPFPPPPPTAGPDKEEGSASAGGESVPVPGPRSPEQERIEAAEARAAEAEKKTEESRRAAEAAREQAAADKVAAAEKAEREAREREAAAEERARAAEARTAEAEARAAGAEKKALDEEPPAGRRHLAVVPAPAQNGDTMSALSVIPEIRTLDGLMNALTLIKAMCEMRAEEAQAVAADDLALFNRLDQLEAELGEMEVDDKTLGEISELREAVKSQSDAAAQYGGAAKDSGDFAVAAANAAYKSHGGIAEAVQSSPIEKAAQGGYYTH
ncbi:hypothetical protein [Streptomyces sp. NPDC056308]|uniref:hypothetical protein n=1 Tax=Streptomyces sp. NPDC056308 TaxID=3345780 RepID=UPI0035D93242